MNPMDKWSITHAYRKKAQEGLLDAWKCPDCGGPVISVIDEDKDDQPMLRCMSCDTNYHLEDEFFERMEEYVKKIK